MIEAKDFISLLVTVDLGILAAALTLLAIYPAVTAAIDKSRQHAGASTVAAHERRRRSVFFWLGFAAASSFLALLALLLNSMGFVLAARPVEIFTICCMPTPDSRVVGEAWTLRGAAFASTASLLGVGRAGWVIFWLTRDAL
jgi:predicted RND superfamily exporter protein